MPARYKKSQVSHMLYRLDAALRRCARLERCLQVKIADTVVPYCATCGAYDHTTEMHHARRIFFPRPISCKICGAYEHVTNKHRGGLE